MKTAIRPIRPAIRPALSDDQPRVADTVWASDALNDKGNDPYLRTLARSLASVWVKSPLTSVVPLMAPLICGALTTLESRVKAVALPMF